MLHLLATDRICSEKSGFQNGLEVEASFVQLIVASKR